MITPVSTKSLFEATRAALLRSQSGLVAAQKETTTGRHADVGKSLGFLTGHAVSLRNDYAQLGAIRDANGIAETRLSATQSVLEGLAEDAQSFLGSLIGARSADGGARVLAAAAEARLKSLVNGINTTIDGVHIFAGIASDSAPLEDYFGNPAPASQAVANAFYAAFGLTPSDPGVSGISKADMEMFLAGDFAALFEEPSWSTNWSKASNENISSRISTNEVIATSANANASAMRKLVSAYVMVADLGGQQLNDGAIQAIVDAAIEAAGGAIQELTGLRTELGIAEDRIATANERMSIAMDVLSKHVTNLEAVDPYEASLRVTSLLTQIETAYALTARLQQMSLIYHL